MAIRIRVADAIIEVDTEQELETVLYTLRTVGGQTKSLWPNKDSKPMEATSKPGYRDFQVFFRSLGNTKQGMLIQALAERSQGMTDKEICAELKLKNNYALAGLMAGLSKKSSKFGFVFHEIVVKEVRPGEQGERYHYRLTDDALETVTSIRDEQSEHDS
ncbi:hypothetical protein ACFLXE_07615 [Chloroflexota bacterium]